MQSGKYVIADVIKLNLKISFVDEIISTESSSLIFREPKEIKVSNKILIKLIQNGNEQARQDLCIKNQGLVEKFAARYEKILNTHLTFLLMQRGGLDKP